MAKAIASCTCKTCGTTFEKVAIKRNRSEADNWINWAQINITECPSCAAKRLRNEENAEGLVAKVRLGNPLVIDNCVLFVLYGDTYSVKNEVKAIGACFTDAYPVDNNLFSSLGLSMQRPIKRWVLFSKGETLEANCEKLKTIGFRIEYPEPDEMAIWSKAYQTARATNAKVERAKVAALAELGEIPAWPEEIRSIWPDGTNWNGKIYGRRGSYSVYFSGKKVFITDEQREMMLRTYELRNKWREEKKRIEGE